MENSNYDYFLEVLRKMVDIPEDVRNLIMSQLKIKYLKKDEIFINLNSTESIVAFIKKGFIRNYYIKNDIEYTSEFFWRGDMVGSFESVFLKIPSTQVLQAIEECELVIINYDEFCKLVKKHPRLERIIRKILENYLVLSRRRIASLILETPEDRYRKLLDRQPELVNRVPQKYLASYLGITPVSLSRIRGRLSNRR